MQSIARKEYGLEPKIKKKDGLKKGLKQWIAVSPYILIGMVLVTVFVIYPQIKNIYMSFTDYKIMPGAKSPFVGLANYKMALFGAERGNFWLAFRNVILYGVFTIPAGMILGLIIAVLIGNVKAGSVFY